MLIYLWIQKNSYRVWKTNIKLFQLTMFTLSNALEAILVLNLWLGRLKILFPPQRSIALISLIISKNYLEKKITHPLLEIWLWEVQNFRRKSKKSGRQYWLEFNLYPIVSTALLPLKRLMQMNSGRNFPYKNVEVSRRYLRPTFPLLLSIGRVEADEYRLGYRGLRLQVIEEASRV